MYKFINPYNFVPFDNDKGTVVKDKRDVYRGEDQEKLLSGWLDVSMLVKTPLIIPDGAHPKYYDIENKIYVDKKEEVKNGKNTHKEYDFLKLYNPETEQEEYAVPGSELRGLIRNSYETVTNSCMPFLLDDKPMSQRVPLYGALNRRGLLGYNGKRWVLYETKKELEEVIVLPVYEIYGEYFVENLDKIRTTEDNLIKDKSGNLKYKIMDSLDDIEEKLSTLKWNGKSISVKNQSLFKDYKRRTCIGHLFIKNDGSCVKQKPGEYVEGKGWLQYNVPVNLRKIYHIAYLTMTNVVHEWNASSPRGDENNICKKDGTYAEAYKKLMSALIRDGAENYRGNKRLNNQSNKDCNFALEKALNNACHNPEQFVPVYYFIVYNKNKNAEGKEIRDEIVYMSGSAAGRIAQRRKWKEIMGDHVPCTNKLCPACLLFGTLADGGMKGHVRFTDAFLRNKKGISSSKHTLQILSSPRTTAFEFYLKKPAPDATYWNYDFYGITETDSSKGKTGTHTNYYHLDKALPRGRKMYWHHPLFPDASKNNMNNTLECIETGTFDFRVYFDQITKDQLTDLIWVISLGDNSEDSSLQYKLGHAKPLGYGSVKLLVNGGTIRTIRKGASGESYQFTISDLLNIINLDDLNVTFDASTETIRSFLKMCDVNAVDNESVNYPRSSIENGYSSTIFDRPIYQWFSDNRTNASQLKVLPEPLDEILFLKGGNEKKTHNHIYHNRKPKKMITVSLTGIGPDNKNPKKKVGYFKGGMVFDIPDDINDIEMTVEVTNERNGKKYCIYVGPNK